MRFKVDLEIEDKDGDRAIHHAAFGNKINININYYQAFCETPEIEE